MVPAQKYPYKLIEKQARALVQTPLVNFWWTGGTLFLDHRYNVRLNKGREPLLETQKPGDPSQA